jgi:hypothetical protein
LQTDDISGRVYYRPVGRSLCFSGGGRGGGGGSRGPNYSTGTGLHGVTGVTVSVGYPGTPGSVGFGVAPSNVITSGALKGWTVFGDPMTQPAVLAPPLGQTLSHGESVSLAKAVGTFGAGYTGVPLTYQGAQTLMSRSLDRSDLHAPPMRIMPKTDVKAVDIKAGKDEGGRLQIDPAKAWAANPEAAARYGIPKPSGGMGKLDALTLSRVGESMFGLPIFEGNWLAGVAGKKEAAIEAAGDIFPQGSALDLYTGGVAQGKGEARTSPVGLPIGEEKHILDPFRTGPGLISNRGAALSKLPLETRTAFDRFDGQNYYDADGNFNFEQMVADMVILSQDPALYNPYTNQPTHVGRQLGFDSRTGHAPSITLTEALGSAGQHERGLLALAMLGMQIPSYSIFGEKGANIYHYTFPMSWFEGTPLAAIHSNSSLNGLDGNSIMAAAQILTSLGQEVRLSERGFNTRNSDMLRDQYGLPPVILDAARAAVLPASQWVADGKGGYNIINPAFVAGEFMPWFVAKQQFGGVEGLEDAMLVAGTLGIVSKTDMNTITSGMNKALETGDTAGFYSKADTFWGDLYSSIRNGISKQLGPVGAESYFMTKANPTEWNEVNKVWMKGAAESVGGIWGMAFPTVPMPTSLDALSAFDVAYRPTQQAGENSEQFNNRVTFEKRAINNVRNLLAGTYERGMGKPWSSFERKVSEFSGAPWSTAWGGAFGWGTPTKWVGWHPGARQLSVEAGELPSSIEDAQRRAGVLSSLSRQDIKAPIFGKGESAITSLFSGGKGETVNIPVGQSKMSTAQSRINIEITGPAGRSSTFAVDIQTGIVRAHVPNYETPGPSEKAPYIDIDTPLHFEKIGEDDKAQVKICAGGICYSWNKGEPEYSKIIGSGAPILPAEIEMPQWAEKTEVMPATTEIKSIDAKVHIISGNAVGAVPSKKGGLDVPVVVQMKAEDGSAYMTSPLLNVWTGEQEGWMTIVYRELPTQNAKGEWSAASYKGNAPFDTSGGKLSSEDADTTYGHRTVSGKSTHNELVGFYRSTYGEGGEKYYAGLGNVAPVTLNASILGVATPVVAEIRGDVLHMASPGAGKSTKDLSMYWDGNAQKFVVFGWTPTGGYT